ncbi:transporter [Frederiksenia canicola]|uniref:Lipopolysaccharide biosynthesis protein WzzE n=2 Tax=Frederiksenia canicola TaxID=123824 RepID=A0ABX9XNQ9_9PAST|nr:transporter [Frederiksenia canicola]RPE90996.1 lipopolysaccharide biosynthesis protein WzzE [Frederiksenia canicola]
MMGFAKNTAKLTACIALGAAVGFGLAEIQTPQWRTTAQFDQPTVQELGNYYALASTYHLVSGEKIDQFDQWLSEKSYGEFKRNLTSPDVIKQFLTEKMQPEQLINAFQFDAKTQQLHLTLSHRETAKPLLDEFIQYANLRSRAALNGELISQWKVLFQQVKTAAETNLGAIQNGSHIAAQDWNGKLTLMKSVQPLDNQLIAYRLVQRPSVPVQPHSPIRNLWMMIGAASGLLLGLFSLSLASFRRNAA